MKATLQLEELGMFFLGIFLFNQMNYSWWYFLILILTPDLSMIGYGFGNKIGTFIYNFFHHKGVAILFYILGIYLRNNWVQCAGIILFSHASMDRIMGYGLKYDKGFKFTHLGTIGKNN